MSVRLVLVLLAQLPFCNCILQLLFLVDQQKYNIAVMRIVFGHQESSQTYFAELG